MQVNQTQNVNFGARGYVKGFSPEVAKNLTEVLETVGTDNFTHELELMSPDIALLRSSHFRKGKIETLGGASQVIRSQDQPLEEFIYDLVEITRQKVKKFLNI